MDNEMHADEVQAMGAGNEENDSGLTAEEMARLTAEELSTDEH